MLGNKGPFGLPLRHTKALYGTIVNMMYCPGPSLLDFVSAKARRAEAADSKKRVSEPGRAPLEGHWLKVSARPFGVAVMPL